MAGRGGAQQPDYKPRPPAGPGAMANRQDMSTGAGKRSTGVTHHPALPVTGTGGPYGQRAALEGLAGEAPRAGAPRPGRPAGPPSAKKGGELQGLMEQMGTGQQEPEEPLAPEPPLADDAFAGYTPQTLAKLEQMLPIFTMMAGDPSAGPEVALLAQLAAEVVMHNQEVVAGPPATQYLGPAPERQGV